MQGKLFDHIQSLEKSRTNWRIKARLTRFWPTFSPETSSIKGYNLILLDDDNSHVHAYVYPDNWRAIGKEVQEGKVYIVQNFVVRDTIGKLKPVSTKICIRLLSTTNIEEVEDDAMIPNHKFEFMEMGDLLEECGRFPENENPEFAVDVIGIVDRFQRVKRVPTRYGERDQTRFVFTDGNLKYNVTLWGELATSVSEKFSPDLQQPVIGILTSAKLTKWKEELQIGALPSTRIYFNLNIDSVAEYRERLIEEGYQQSEDSIEVNVVNPTNNVIERTNFKDLADHAGDYAIKRSVIVSFTINKIEEEDNWWFNSCISCHLEVEKVEKKFKCQNCKRNFGYCEKRFRLFVLVEDSTLAANVILLDRVVKRLAGTTVANILNEIKKDKSVGVVANLFKLITGKEVSVLLELSDANITGESNVYQATDLCDSSSPEVSIVEASPAPSANSFSMNGAVAGIELFQTPGSSRSVTKKIKMEDDSP